MLGISCSRNKVISSKGQCIGTFDVVSDYICDGGVLQCKKRQPLPLGLALYIHPQLRSIEGALAEVGRIVLTEQVSCTSVGRCSLRVSCLKVAEANRSIFSMKKMDDVDEMTSLSATQISTNERNQA